MIDGLIWGVGACTSSHNPADKRRADCLVMVIVLQGGGSSKPPTSRFGWFFSVQFFFKGAELVPSNLILGNCVSLGAAIAINRYLVGDRTNKNLFLVYV